MPKKIYKVIFIEDTTKLDTPVKVPKIASTIIIINIASVFRFVILDENCKMLKETEMDTVDIEKSIAAHFDKQKYWE